MTRVMLVVIACFGLAPIARAQKPSVFPERRAQPARAVLLPNGAAGAIGETSPRFDTSAAEQFKKHCPTVDVQALPAKADYLALYSETLTYHLTIIRRSGNVVWSGSGAWSKGGMFKKACAAILKDWKQEKHNEKQ